MKYFGLSRVLEPTGAIPSTAWKLDNSPEIREKEIKVALEIIKLEINNFNQILSSCEYNEQKTKAGIFSIINKRGKLQNPYTESSGIICGTIEAISPNCDTKFKKGDRIISLTSMSGCPMYIEEITKIDYNYGEIWCKGYAILFEASQIAPVPDDIDIRPFLSALDEEGSLIDVRDVLVERKPSKIAIVGSRLIEIMLYSQMAKHYDEKDIRLIVVMDYKALSYITEKEIYKTFNSLIDKVYFADMARPVEASYKILEEEKEFCDAVINLEDIPGAETIAAMTVKNRGFLFHTGVKRNYFQSMLAVDCMGKEVVNYVLDGYAEEVYDYAHNLIIQAKENLKVLDRLFSHRLKKNIAQEHLKVTSKPKEPQKIDDFVYMSSVTGDMIESVLNVAKYDCNVIIQGETGVGKEKIMEILHKNSSRKSKPCIKINCATIQENLAESEFFGYEKGSFTGAQAAGKEGYFEMANNGILFLDEIGTLSLTMQSKLLRVLQENSYYRVGGTEQKHVNVRVVCANNIPLKKLVDEGKFREDLYYRLNICLIEVPPLRQRKEDVKCLADTFIANYSTKYGIKKTFSANALEKLSEYHWPGNVRELENTVHRLYISEREDVIDELAVDSLLSDTFYDDVAIDIKKEFQRNDTIDFTSIMEKQEKKLIAYALKKGKTTRAAAELLNIPQPTLARKKIKHGL